MPSRVGKGNPEDSIITKLIRERFPLKTVVSNDHPTKEKEPKTNENASVLKN